MATSNTTAKSKTSRLEEDGCHYQTSEYLRQNLEVCDSGVSLSMRDDLISCQSVDEGFSCSEITDSQSRCQSLVYESGIMEDLEHCQSKLNTMLLSDCFSNALSTTVLPADCCENKADAPPTTVQQVPVEGVTPLQDLYQELFSQDEDGDTKLHMAIIQPDVDAAMWMIAATAPYRPTPLNIQNDRFRQTPLHLAVVTNQPRIVRMLVICGALLEVRDRNGYTPLQVACARGMLDCIKAITIPVTDDERNQLVNYCEDVKLRCFVPPAYRRPNLNCSDYEGCSCLHLAQKLDPPRRLELIQYLVMCGADPNIKDGKGGQSVLHLAVKQRDVELVRYLCQSRILNINDTNYGQQTALDIALQLKYGDVVELLQSHGALHSDLFSQQDEPITDSSEEESDDTMDDYDDLVICGQPLNCH